VNWEAQGRNLMDLPEVVLVSYVNDEGRFWPHQIKNEINLWPTRETRNTH
jgi:hypothetical protein